MKTDAELEEGRRRAQQQCPPRITDVTERARPSRPRGDSEEPSSKGDCGSPYEFLAEGDPVRSGRAGGGKADNAAISLTRRFKRLLASITHLN